MRKLVTAGLGAAAVALLGWLASLELPAVSWLAAATLWAAGLLALLWLLWRGLSLFLWRVGRRLAFSYFLIGVLPIPMVLCLFGLVAYIHSGFFIGHLYRDAVSGLHADLSAAAALHLDLPPARRTATGDDGRSYGYYRDGLRVAGSPLAPSRFPDWLAADPTRLPSTDGASGRERVLPFVALEDGAPTVAAAAARGTTGVIVWWSGDVEAEVARRSDVAIRLTRSDDPEKEQLVQLRLFGKEIPLQPPGAGWGGSEPAAAEAPAPPSPPGESADPTAGAPPASRAPEPAPEPWLDRPVLWWGELSGPLRSLADGSEAAEYVTASLAASPRAVYRHLFSSSAEIDTVAWAAVVAVSSLLATIYFVAVIMALSMSFTLSRAVNRLSSATSAVRAGDFSSRIPVRRRDQVGESFQRSFNDMAENLEAAVDAAAEAEILEKELEIARDLQQSLLPRDLPKSDSVEFATLFEPSAAIGGDYFDILRLDEDHLAVVTADVSGHGLPTGLRMAMLKAALTILVEEGRDTPEILAKLDRMVRTGDDARYFVTLTLARLDFRDGTLDLTNAGHPPTYLVRGRDAGGEVEEIELPGPPLGALGSDYGRRSVTLEPGDVAVWLSDGLIEATAENGEMFGYARVREALAGPAGSPAVVRDRLLAAVARHTGGAAAEDDRTLVVMGYRLGV